MLGRLWRALGFGYGGRRHRKRIKKRLDKRGWGK